MEGDKIEVLPITAPPPTHPPHQDKIEEHEAQRRSNELPREATELDDIETDLRRRDSNIDSKASTAPGNDRTPKSLNRHYSQPRKEPKWYDPVQTFWRRNVSVVVDASSRRDHLALERTFLGYLRTSVYLSIIGVTIAQLFRLQHSITPDNDFGFYVLGKPLAAIFIGAAAVTAGLGSVRFWRQQNAMIRGKVHAGGWEILTIMIGSILLSVMLFILAVAVDVRRED